MLVCCFDVVIGECCGVYSVQDGSFSTYLVDERGLVDVDFWPFVVSAGCFDLVLTGLVDVRADSSFGVVMIELERASDSIY